VRIDREQDLGEYWEPNIWLIHQPGQGDTPVDLLRVADTVA
jgi:hypothetical protein